MAILRPDPDLFDIDGWRELVEELRMTAPEQADIDHLAYAEAHLAAISASRDTEATEQA